MKAHSEMIAAAEAYEVAKAKYNLDQTHEWRQMMKAATLLASYLPLGEVLVHKGKGYTQDENVPFGIRVFHTAWQGEGK